MNVIDYQYWFNLDGWTVKEAALLLTGLDPDENPKPRFANDVPSELKQASKLRRVFLRKEGINTYGQTEHFWFILAAHGFVKFNEAVQNQFENILINFYGQSAQRDGVAKQWFEEGGMKFFNLSKNLFEKSGKDLDDFVDGRGAHNKDREKESSLKLMGVLSRMLVEEKGRRVKLNGRLNLEQYTSLILEYMDFSGIEGDGLSKNSIKTRLDQAEKTLKNYGA